ncbi:hypothetical protein LTR09_000046 [Extremus antarcticus]|uniref:Piwi domain-containing protein n=1 Tax=Extremus antarcticus TaxID=702011 RepID=A0AAJ0LWY7_9PEZI|nr:hypothetical protein LTR09_000046 [Extremus antarcticus]
MGPKKPARRPGKCPRCAVKDDELLNHGSAPDVHSQGAGLSLCQFQNTTPCYDLWPDFPSLENPIVTWPGTKDAAIDFIARADPQNPAYTKQDLEGAAFAAYPPMSKKAVAAEVKAQKARDQGPAHQADTNVATSTPDVSGQVPSSNTTSTSTPAQIAQSTTSQTPAGGPSQTPWHTNHSTGASAQAPASNTTPAGGSPQTPLNTGTSAAAPGQASPPQQDQCFRCPSSLVVQLNHGPALEHLSVCQHEVNENQHGVQNLWPGFRVLYESAVPWVHDQDLAKLRLAGILSEVSNKPRFEIQTTGADLEELAKIAFPPMTEEKFAEDARRAAAQASHSQDLASRMENSGSIATSDATAVPSPGAAASTAADQVVVQLPPLSEIPEPEFQDGNFQQTDPVGAQTRVRAHAQRLLDQEAVRPFGEDFAAGKTRMIRKYGLRTSFGPTKGDVIANFLNMEWPKRIYVYDMAMYRPGMHNGQQSVVKKQWDMIEALEVLLRTQQTDVDVMALNKNLPYWVTDGTMIWSTRPIFNESETAPGSYRHGQLPPQQLQYDNECGRTLVIDSIFITFHQAINLSRPVSELFHDSTSAKFKDSVPNILVKGLNAFFSRHARRLLSHPATARPHIPHATAQTSNDNPFVCVGASKSFHGATAGRDLDPRKTIAAKSGFSLSVRPGVASMYVNLSKATSPFFAKSITVQDFIDAARGRSENEIINCLKGLKVEIKLMTNNTAVTFPKVRNRIRFIKEVSTKNVFQEDRLRPGQWPQLPFEQQTVGHWFDANSPYRRQHPHPDFPNPPVTWSRNVNDRAVNVGKDAIRNPEEVEWWPAQCLHIVPWQSFSGRITPDQTTEMIKAAQVGPMVHKDQLTSGPNSGLAHFAFTAPAQGRLADAGMSVGLEFIRMPSRVIPNPPIQYRRWDARADCPKDFTQNSFNASWNLQKVMFKSTVELKELYILNISGEGPDHDQPPSAFYQALFNHGLTANVGVHTTYLKQTITGQDLAWENNFAAALRALRFQGIQDGMVGNDPLVMVVLARKDQDTYAHVKRVADLRMGAKTVCITHDHLMTVNPQLYSNVAMKINLRQGGVNHVPGTNAFVPLRVSGANSPANTIVVGADVTHPGNGSFTATPSIAAVVGSVDDDFVVFPGSVRLQQSKKEDIVELAVMVKERLVAWAKLHGDQLPTNVLFYRDGVSESQYDILRRRELPQVQVAMNLAYEELHSDSIEPDLDMPGRPKPPSDGAKGADSKKQDNKTAQALKSEEEALAAAVETYAANQPLSMTFVVVGKRHNTRFYPSRAADYVKPPNDNVKTGLVVDQVITHPYHMDFYLQSHLPLKGTGRSAHYFPLRNEMALSAQQLHEITNNFCYIYARATRGVSYCAPAYYADRLCDRARCYLRYKLLGRPGYQPRPINRPNETWAQYCDAIKTQLETDGFHWNRWVAPTNPPNSNPWSSTLNNSMFYL